jgi:hypothetical protein
VDYLCSNAQTTFKKGNVKTLTTPYTVAVVNKKTQDVVCQRTGPEIRETILSEKKLLLPKDCPELSDKSYEIRLTALRSSQDVNYANRGLLFGTHKDGVLNIEATEIPHMSKESTNNRKQSVTRFLVLYDKNTSRDIQSDDVCDKRASPLFINLDKNSRPTHLSSILNGVQFDILGANAKPVPHAKKQISWFQESNLAFLVKPNSKGLVEGVNEMFGNNTMGPDRRMAHDGFAALAKFDSNRDGIIDEKDPVFKQLRLWVDIDRDGVSDIGELSYLDANDIVAIDLKFDKSYYEKDKYGNEIYYKSIVKMKDDSVRLIFDLWFRYL